jgi:protein TonB
MTRVSFYQALGLSAALHGAFVAVALFYTLNRVVPGPAVPLPLPSTLSLVWQAPEAPQIALNNTLPTQLSLPKQDAPQACVTPPLKHPSSIHKTHHKADKARDELPAASPAAVVGRTPPSIAEISLNDAYMPAPPYPAKARQLGYEGLIHLKAFLKHNGQIHWLEVIEANAPLMLVNAALKTVKKWHFDHATAQQYPVLIIPVRFKLSA